MPVSGWDACAVRPDKTIRIPREAQFMMPSAKTASPSGTPGMLWSARANVRHDLPEPWIGDDLRGARAVFLGGLEQQDGPSPGGAVASEPPGNAGQNGRMPIMAAEMGLARDRRAMRRVAELLDRQGVDVAAQKDRGAFRRAFENGGDPVTAKPGEETVRCGGCQHLDNAGRRLGLFAGQFRVAMQLAPPSGQRLRCPASSR